MTEQEIQEAAGHAGTHFYGDEVTDARANFQLGFAEGAKWHQDQWIDVKEQMPANEQEVIVYSKFTLNIRGLDTEYEYLCSALYDSETRTFLDRYHKVIPKVSWWQPLPQPPKEKDNG